MKESEKQKTRQEKLEENIREIVGERYITIIEKAEGVAILTADAMTGKEIELLIEAVNGSLQGMRMADSHGWIVKPVGFQGYRHIIEGVPAEHRGYVGEKTPLMELRLLYIENQ